MRRPPFLPTELVLVLVVSAVAGAGSAPRSGGPPDLPKKVHNLSTPAERGAGEPRLVATPDGGVLMSWLEPRPSGGLALRVASLRGARWSPRLTIAEGDSIFVNGADFPTLCAFGAHGIAVAWPWKSGHVPGAHQTRVTMSRDGGGQWCAPVTLHDDRAGNEHGFVSLVAQGEGVRTVWLDGHNVTPGIEEGMADMTLHSRFVAPTGTLGREQELDGRVCDCCPTSAIAVGEHLLVAYRDRSDEEIRDISLVRLEAGRWGPPVTLHADGWKIAGCPVNGPALANAGTRVAAAWYTAAADSPRVYAAFSGDGGRSFGTPVRVDEGRPLGRVGIVIVSGDAAAVSWVEGDKVDARVRVRTVSEGARPAPAVTVARLTAGRPGGIPQMVRDGDRLVFAWTETGKNDKVRLAEIALPRR